MQQSLFLYPILLNTGMKISMLGQYQVFANACLYFNGLSCSIIHVIFFFFPLFGFCFIIIRFRSNEVIYQEKCLHDRLGTPTIEDSCYYSTPSSLSKSL